MLSYERHWIHGQFGLFCRETFIFIVTNHVKRYNQIFQDATLLAFLVESNNYFWGNLVIFFITFRLNDSWKCLENTGHHCVFYHFHQDFLDQYWESTLYDQRCCVGRVSSNPDLDWLPPLFENWIKQCNCFKSGLFIMFFPQGQSSRFRVQQLLWPRQQGSHIRDQTKDPTKKLGWLRNPTPPGFCNPAKVPETVSQCVIKASKPCGRD